MSASDSEALLKQAMAAVNAGDLTKGRALLEQILEKDPQNDWAWVWLSGCVEDPLQRRICLQQALKANPNNPAALDGMKVLDGELVQVSSTTPSLLESRLAAIGIGEPVTAEATVSAAATMQVEAPETVMSHEELLQQNTTAVPAKPRGSRWWLWLILGVFLLTIFVCGLVLWQVVLPLLGAFESM
ncbi:MAG: tetratricopeptide repeat protein [Anaerolineae bacterium]